MADKPSPMRSLERSIDVLEVLDAAREPLRLSEIARRAGLPVATTQRILNVLESRQRVERDQFGYWPGVALTFGAHAFLSTSPLLRVARPTLIDLAQRSGLTATLFQEHGHQRVMLTREGPMSRRLAYELPVGARLPLNLGAGKVLLAQWDDQELATLFATCGEELVDMAGNPIDPDALMRELRTIRANGYSTARSERVPGVASVAAAIPLQNSPRIALQVAGYEEDIPQDRTPHLGLEVQRAALAIARDMPSAHP